MIIYVDIDETICKSSFKSLYGAKTGLTSINYEKAVPIGENITKINELYESGHTIIYWTARGTGTGIDWRNVTERQFEKWGVKYHQLKFGKPIYDLFIDDKNINSDVFFGVMK